MLYEWHNHKQTSELVSRRDLPACIQSIALRLTKVPVLLERMRKASTGDEWKKLNEALELVKNILDHINSEVEKNELIIQRAEIVAKLSATSAALFNNAAFRKGEILDRPLMYVYS